MYEAYPLQWPDGYKRTKSRFSSKFKTTMDTAQNFLRAEIKRLGSSGLIVSTNLPVRQDGLLYADWMRRKIDDPGVAIYFKYQGKQVSMCCDQYHTIWENIYALGKGIEAIRGLERWGVSEFLERAFYGFSALPPVAEENDIWLILGLNVKPDAVEAVKEAYRAKSKIYHPDVPGGSQELFVKLNNAYNRALTFYK